MGNEATEKKKYTVESVQKRDFKGMMTTTLVEYRELAEIINEYFKQIFKDYKGCRPMIYEGQRISVLLAFVPGLNNNIGAIAGVEEIQKAGAAKGNNIIANYINSNISRAVNNGEHFTLTQAAKDILKDYIITFPNAKDINWSNITGQHIVGTFQDSSVEYRVINIDLNLLIADIYDSGDKKYTYSVNIMRNAINGMNVHNSKMFEIVRADNLVVAEINNKYFAYPLNDGDDFIIQ